MRIENSTEFGNLIRKSRKKSKLSQKNLAAASGIGERFIRELEQGKPTCQLEKALRIAQMLGIIFEATLPFVEEESKD